MRLLFIGPPGAGKGTQAQGVAEALGIPHVSTGEMFRAQVEAGTELGRRVKSIMESGDYVPDEMTIDMLAERLAEPDASSGFILDGFPRTRGQAKALDRLVGRRGLDKVVVLDVPETELMDRLLARGRADDTEETVRNRFQAFREETVPLIELYVRRGIVVRVDGVGDVAQVTRRVLEALGRRRGKRRSRISGPKFK